MADPDAAMIGRRARSRIPRPLRDIGWHQARWSVVDVETTGLDLRTDEMISIGVVPVDRGVISSDGGYYSLVRPACELRSESIEVHGIRAGDLINAPAPQVVASDLSLVLADRLVVAHAAWIEDAFLRRLARSTGLPIALPVLDTAALCRASGLKSVNPLAEPSLEGTALTLGLPVFSPHHAFGDAMTTAVVFLALVSRLQRQSATELTVADLVQISEQYRN